MKIYTKIGKQHSIKKFLTLFFSEYKGNYLTNVETYSDIDCKDIQCSAKRYRSFDDMLLIVNTYYKNVSAEKLINILYNLNIKDKRVHVIYCNNINKVTLLFNNSYPTISNSDTNKGIGKYSQKELSEMIKF